MKTTTHKLSAVCRILAQICAASSSLCCSTFCPCRQASQATNPAVWNVPCLFLLCPEIHLYPVVLCSSSRNIKVCSILFCQPFWFKRRTLWFAFLVLYTQNSSVIGSSSNNFNKDNIGRNLSLKISCMGFYAFKIKFSWLLFLKECDITDQFCEVKLWQRTDRTLLLHCAD